MKPALMKSVPMKRARMLPALLAFCFVPALGAQEGTEATASAAADHATTVQRILARMDRDNDGKVGFEEYRNAMTRRFHAVDKNGDGALEVDELPEEWVVVNAADIPATGMSLENFSDHMRSSFDSFDANKDGSLDNDELTALAKARAAKMEAKP